MKNIGIKLDSMKLQDKKTRFHENIRTKNIFFLIFLFNSIKNIYL